MTDQNYIDVSCPTCGAVPKHGHVCTPPKDVEEIVEQYAQSLQDMYFLAGAKISVETWNNTKDMLRNAITTHTDRRVREAVKQRDDYWYSVVGTLTDQPRDL